MPSRSAVTWAACQRALSWGLAFAAARKPASFLLRRLGAWMRIAATASRGVRGEAGATSPGVSLIPMMMRHPGAGGRAPRRRPARRVPVSADCHDERVLAGIRLDAD